MPVDLFGDREHPMSLFLRFGSRIYGRHNESGNNGINYQDLQKELQKIIEILRPISGVDMRRTRSSSGCSDLNMDTNTLIKRVDFTIKKSTCFHPSFKKRICMACGQEANDNNTFASIIYDTSVPLKYRHEDLRNSLGEIARVKDKNTKYMLSRQRKLHLVLDLDHTLLHSIYPNELKENEEYLWNNVCNRDVAIGELSYVSYLRRLVKTRPYVQKFLEKASTMFNMYVYTMASRD